MSTITLVATKRCRWTHQRYEPQQQRLRLEIFQNIMKTMKQQAFFACILLLIWLAAVPSAWGVVCCPVWNPNPAKLPGPDPGGLWIYLTQSNPYKNWAFWWDHKDFQPGREPHGAFHRIYVNLKARRSYQAPVQYGTIIVEENYNRDKKLESIAVMYKIKGFNPEGGDWFWVKYLPDRWPPEVQGKVSDCINCHRSMESNDFIFSHELKEPPEAIKMRDQRMFIHEVW